MKVIEAQVVIAPPEPPQAEANLEGQEEEKKEEAKEEEPPKEQLPIVGFSKFALTHLVKHVVVLLSLAESSDDAAKLPFRVMSPDDLVSLVQLSLAACPSVQILVQKIFQSMLRLSLPVSILDKAVE